MKFIPLIGLPRYVVVGVGKLFACWAGVWSWACLTGIAASAAFPFAAEHSPLPARYRDFQMYSVSQSATTPGDAGTIRVQTKIVNRGEKPLEVHVLLKAEPRAGFAGDEFKHRLAGNSETTWNWKFKPPAGLKRVVLQGSVAFGNVVDRDLSIAIEGRDPVDFSDKRVQQITDAAAVVATFLPRRAESIRASRSVAKAPAAPMLTLGERGQTRYRIVLSPAPSQPQREAKTISAWAKNSALKPQEQELLQAVADLQRCLKLQSGAELPVSIDPQAPSPAVRISLNTETGSSPQTDAYRLATEAGSGDVRIQADTLNGLRNGIYGLLTDHLDCHWFQPGTLGEEIVIPADQTVRLPQLAENVKPSFFSSNGCSWGAARQWDLRTRSFINRGRMNFGHSWQNYINPGTYPYEKFPDMYARDREGKLRKRDTGWTWTNFCSTNPQVIEIVAKRVNDMVRSDPESIVVSLDPNDYAPMCLCDRCLALDKHYGQKDETGTEVADRLLHFSKQMYDRLEPANKRIYLGILIYGYQMDVPHGAKPHPHHVGTICNFPTRYDHTRPFSDPTSPKNIDFLRLVKGWGSKLTQLGYYDYYGHWYYFGPWAMTQKMREDLPTFRDLGGTFLVLENQPNFASQGINHYISARLTWNVDSDVDQLLDELFQKYYGPAENAVRGYWSAAERRFCLTRSGTHAERAAFEPEFWAELDSHLRQAEQAVAAASVPQRFKDRVKFLRDGYTYGLAAGKLGRFRRQKLPTDPKKLEEFRQNLFQGAAVEKEMFQKYGTPGDYYPPFVPGYFWPKLEEQIQRFKKEGKFGFLEDV